MIHHTHKMTVRKDDLPIPEEVPLRKIGDGEFLVVGVPIFARCGFGDIIEGFERGVNVEPKTVMRNSGWSTIGVWFDPVSTGDSVDMAFRKVQSIGCIVTKKASSVFAIAVPPGKLPDARAIVEWTERRGTWRASLVLQRDMTITA